MGFRDNDLATRSRVEALEQELEVLRAKNAQLEAREKKDTPGRDSGRFSLAVLLLSVSFAGAGAIYSRDEKVVVILTTLACFLVVVAAIFALARNFLIVPARHILVISGLQHSTPDGRQIGYRIVTNGSAFRRPLVETSSLLPTGPFSVEATIVGVYAKGNQPADLRIRSSVVVLTDEPNVHNAVERFAGRSQREIETVAQETLEGHMRGIAAQLTLQELREDRLRLAEALRSEAQADLARMGLSLDSFDILEVRERRD